MSVKDPGRLLVDFIKKYGPAAGESGPLRLVREVFRAKPDDWQADVLCDFGRGERSVAIRSAHGPGKTCVVAWAIWAMLLTRFPQKTIATAPTKGQLFDGLFTEVLAWGDKLPPELRDLYLMKGGNRIELIASPANSFFTARTARPETPEALQGIHSEHVLLVGDEASGIPEPIFEAGAGSMSGEHATTILLGNPIRSTGLFFDVFNKQLEGWKRYHVRAASVDWPTGIPSERVRPKFVREMAERYGEESNAYRTRVLGEFPKGDDDTVISFELVESARNREIETLDTMPYVWGIDVARFGSAINALVARNRRGVTRVDTWEGVDLMQTSGRIKAKWDALLPGDKPYCILIDVNGLGGGVVDRLTELGLPVRGINVGEAAAIKDRFLYLRDELWWRGREWLEQRDVMLPTGTMGKRDPVERMCKELTLPRYTYQSSGKIKVESKAELKKRGHASPDIADAFMLTMAEDISVLQSGYSAFGGAAWNEDLPDRSVGVP